MMERYLVTPEQWERWLALLEAHPGHEDELDARAALLLQRREDPGAPGVVEDVLMRVRELAPELLDDAAPEEDDDAPVAEVVPLRPRRLPWRSLSIAALGMAAGVLLTLSVLPDPSPDEGPRLRGEEHAVSGTVRLEQARRPLAVTDIGQGIRPRVAVRADAPLVLFWQPGPTTSGRALAWTVDAEGNVRGPDGGDGPRAIDGPIVLDATPPATLVVAVAPADADPADIARRIGDARQPVDDLGSVRVVAFDLTADAAR